VGRAKVAGLVIDRKEVGAPNEFENMSTEELREFVMREAESLSIPIGSGGRKHHVD
jgi:hypothetical protein